MLDSRSKDGRSPLHREGFAGQTLCDKPIYGDSEVVSHRPIQSRACRECEAKEQARVPSLPTTIAAAKKANQKNELPKCRKCGDRIKGEVSASGICYPCLVPTRILPGGAPGLGRRS